MPNQSSSDQPPVENPPPAPDAATPEMPDTPPTTSEYHRGDLLGLSALVQQRAAALGTTVWELEAALFERQGPFTRDQIVHALREYRKRPV